jgi:hypothetical protein
VRKQLGGTPDDRSGGITDAGKLILRDEGETADNPGEAVFDGTNFVMRDNAGPFNPRTGGASFDEKVKVSANDTTTDYLGAKVVAGTGVTVTEKDDGANETLEVAVTPGGGGGIAHLPAPAQEGVVRLCLRPVQRSNDSEVVRVSRVLGGEHDAHSRHQGL